MAALRARSDPLSLDARENPVLSPGRRLAATGEPVLDGADGQERRDAGSDCPRGEIAFGDAELGGKAG